MVVLKINVEMVKTEADYGAKMNWKVRNSTISYTMLLRSKDWEAASVFRQK